MEKKCSGSLIDELQMINKITHSNNNLEEEVTRTLMCGAFMTIYCC